jgi:hypothetical protein
MSQEPWPEPTPEPEEEPAESLEEDGTPGAPPPQEEADES